VVIEKVSGQTYRPTCRTTSSAAGPEHTGYDVSETILPSAPPATTARRQRAINTPVPGHALPYAAGSLYSTGDDLLAWDVALRSGKVDQPGLGDRHVHGLRLWLRLRPVPRPRDGKRYWSTRRHQRLTTDAGALSGRRA
jgi:hypothetical protein